MKTQKNYMYKLIDVFENTLEKEFYDALFKMNANMYMREKDVSANANVYFFDLINIDYSDILLTAEALKIILENYVATESKDKNIVIFNVDYSKVQCNKLAEFISNLLRKNSKGTFIQVDTFISAVGMSNYAKMQFGYTEYFTAPTIEKIEKVHKALNDMENISWNLRIEV